MSESEKGRLAVVGLGPGATAWCTPEAAERVRAATDLVGYGPYLRQIGPLADDQEAHPFPNRKEAERAVFALDLAASGRDVAVVSSGDPGIFAMATAVVEELHRESASARWAEVEVTIIPGVTAATAAAARIGAPLGHDLCLISLSDVLKPWEVIERRVRAAAMADFVIALYNPASRHRPWQLQRALDLIAEHRSAETPVVEAHDVGRPEETISTLTLGHVDPATVDMGTVLLVGSSATRQFTDAAGRSWVYTPRRYPTSLSDPGS